jgi:hypothetical protein
MGDTSNYVCKCGDSRPNHACAVSVPAEKIAALREAVKGWGNDRLTGDSGLLAAARAVVDAVGTEAEPLCKCEHTRGMHDICHFDHNECLCGCREFIPAAHMAAPDELTALRQEIQRQEQLRKTVRVKYRNQRDEALAERDALRERIDKALARVNDAADYSCKSEWDQRQYDELMGELRTLLGDA